MQVKRYEASSIREILPRIKRELGPEAIVLSTKQLPGAEGRMEVLAALDDGFEKKGFPGENAGSPLNEDADGKQSDGFLFLKQELSEIKSLLRNPQRGGMEAALAQIKERADALLDLSASRFCVQGSGDALRDIYFHLVEGGFSSASAARLVADVQEVDDAGGSVSFEQGLQRIGLSVRRTFAEKQEKEQRVKVFLGPTGVGKTTTLAKIAARCALHQRKSVGLITADTYRIGAIEQLKTYAEIIDLPLEIADSKDGMRRALGCFQDRDCILVDTPGRGGDAADYLTRLRGMFPKETKMEANLLLSPTSSRENMLDVAARFDVFGFDQVIFTKIDECRRFGSLYDVMEKIGKPVSYLANGQNVPQDIEKATPGRLAEMIVNVG